MKVDIHNFEKKLKRRIELINSSDTILGANKQFLMKFYHSCVAEGLSLARIEKCFSHLYPVACLLKKPFTECTKEDLIKLVEVIERKDISEWTKHDYKVVLKKFFRWLRGTEEYPDEVKWIKAKSVRNNQLPEEILTEEEIKKIVSFATNPRDRAFVLVLYESACRIGELLSLRIKNMQSDAYGCVLLVNGKTGSRRVRIISSAPALSTWLESHPFKNDPMAPLWIVIGTRNHHEMMSYASACALLRRLAKRAGIKKRVNPHSFRHARATHLANVLTEAQMKQYFGWVQGSDMASIYVHLSGRDVDNALLKLHGLAQNEKKEEDILKLRICPKCQEKNDPVSKFCRRCGSALDIKIAMELENEILKKDEVVSEVVKRLVEKLNLEKEVCEVIKELKLEREFERKG